MLIPGKFVLGCVAFGGLTFMGTALLQMPAAQDSSAAHVLPAVSAKTAQSAINQAHTIYRQQSTNLSPALQSFAAASQSFINTNATTARLQFDGMANDVSAHLSFDAWVPADAPYWVRGGAQVAAQATTSQAITLSSKVPVVKALKSNVSHLLDVQP